MTIRVSILQIGKGTIGGALIDQIAERRAALRAEAGVDLVHVAIAGREEGAFDPEGIRLETWRRSLAPRGTRTPAHLVREAARVLRGPAILVDATAGDGMAGLYCEALQAGFHVVACNKKPFAGPLEDYRRMKEAARAAGRYLLHEVTVGAGLPVIGSLRALIDSGDRIRSIEGCFSGTLNFLCAGLDRGEPFSAVLARARTLGYTEPDPREDIAGQDVARKALILAREAGLPLEPSQVRLEPFCAVGRHRDAEAFLSGSAALDGPLGRSWEEVMSRGKRLRYVAVVNGGCGAGLREVPADHPLGRLTGPENVFAFSTERYPDHPLVVAGPGAGPAVTAAGAFGDILTVARAVVSARAQQA
jgi:bifunctional aspartokinase / homoserine dehydrogenase 1